MRSQNISSFVKALVRSLPATTSGYILASASSLAARVFPLTISRQLIKFEGDGMSYEGSQVPYRTPRAPEIWEATEKAAEVLELRRYAGRDFVLADLPMAVDVNARPTTSIIGIAKVMREEIRELMLRARFGGMPERVHLEGEWVFRMMDLVANYFMVFKF